MNMQEEMSKKSQKIWEYNSPKNVMRRIDAISEFCKKLIPIALFILLILLIMIAMGVIGEGQLMVYLRGGLSI